MESDDALTLSDEQLDRLADLLAFKLAQAKPATPVMLTVEDVSAIYQVSRAWVYENAARLGGVKLGPGQRAPLRFDVRRVEAAMNPLGRPDLQKDTGPRHTARRRPRSKRLHPVYDG
jgi:hypothetical protein